MKQQEQDDRTKSTIVGNQSIQCQGQGAQKGKRQLKLARHDAEVHKREITLQREMHERSQENLSSKGKQARKLQIDTREPRGRVEEQMESRQSSQGIEIEYGK